MADRILHDLEIKRKDRERNVQHAWTLVSVVVLIITLVYPLQYSTGDIIANIIRSIISSVALSSFIGSAYLTFTSNKKSTVYVRQQSVNDVLISQNVIPSPTTFLDLQSFEPKFNRQSSHLSWSAFKLRSPNSTMNSALSPSRQNFDYNAVPTATANIISRMKSPSLSGSVIDSASPSVTSSIFTATLPSAGNQTQQTPQSASMKLPRYYPSPMSEANSPLTLSEQLAPRGRGGVARTVDALSSLQLTDIGAIDDWVENLKCALGRYLVDTLRRFDECTQLLLRGMSQRGLPQDVLLSVQRVLTLTVDSEPIGVSGESMNLDQVLNQCRAMQLPEVNDYLVCYGIFFRYGETIRPGGASKLMTQRLRALATHVSNDPDRYLHIDSNVSKAQLSSLHDADVVMSLFLHLCDTSSDSHFGSSRLSSVKFSDSHYVDDINVLPEPSLPGLSRGVDRVGIVRDSRSIRLEESRAPFANADSRFGALLSSSPLVETGSGSAFNDTSRPHFNLFVVHNYRKDKPPSRLTPTRSAYAGLGMTAKTSAGGLSVYEPWVAGDVGVEVLNVLDGRQNCFECIVLLLLLLVLYHDPSIGSEYGRSSNLQRLALEVFRARDLRELDSILSVHRVFAP